MPTVRDLIDYLEQGNNLDAPVVLSASEAVEVADDQREPVVLEIFFHLFQGAEAERTCPKCTLPMSYADQPPDQPPTWVCDGPNDNTEQEGCGWVTYDDVSKE